MIALPINEAINLIPAGTVVAGRLIVDGAFTETMWSHLFATHRIQIFREVMGIIPNTPVLFYGAGTPAALPIQLDNDLRAFFNHSAVLAVAVWNPKTDVLATTQFLEIHFSFNFTDKIADIRQVGTSEIAVATVTYGWPGEQHQAQFVAQMN